MSFVKRPDGCGLLDGAETSSATSESLLRFAKTSPGVGARGVLRRYLLAVLSALHTWQRRIQERRELAGLSDQDLRDIAITRYDARIEAAKPFWRD
jgi:uncharacterized protein YjiS (DUF1127 family)